MLKEIYQMPLNRAIREFFMDELQKIFSKTHTAFLAAVLKAKHNLLQMYF